MNKISILIIAFIFFSNCSFNENSRIWNGKGKNLVLITHYSIITAVTTAVPSSGEMVITDKNFKVLGVIQTH